MKIQIWSDIACPFCYIGKRRLEKALAQFPKANEVEIEWKSFQLNPNAPFEKGEPMQSCLEKAKGMSAEQVRARL